MEHDTFLHISVWHNNVTRLEVIGEDELGWNTKYFDKDSFPNSTIILVQSDMYNNMLLPASSSL